MGLKNGQKQGRDENTRRRSCCREVVVKKDWKTTILLLPDLIFATEVVLQSFFTTTFLQRDSVVKVCLISYFCMSQELYFAGYIYSCMLSCKHV